MATRETMTFNFRALKSPDSEFELVSKLGEGNYGAVYKVYKKNKKDNAQHEQEVNS